MIVPKLPIVFPKLFLNPEGDLKAFPRCTVARSSSAAYFNSNGVLVNAAANVPRISVRSDTLKTPGLLMENSRTNLVKNSAATGSVLGVTGSGGSLPTGWTHTPFSMTNINTEIVGTGTEDGIPYVDIRLFGTATLNYHGIVFHGGATGSGDIVADSYYGNSVFARVVSGAIPVSVTFKSRFDNAQHNAIDTNKTLNNANLTAASLGRSRQFVLGKSPPTVSGSWQTLFVYNFTVGSTVDFTVRYGVPQVELGSGSSSPILTNGSQVTRSSDQIELALPSTTDFTLFTDFSLESVLSLSRVTGMFNTADQSKYISVVAAKEDMNGVGGAYSPPDINIIATGASSRYKRAKVAYNYRQSTGALRVAVDGKMINTGSAVAGMSFDKLVLSGMTQSSPNHKLGGLLHRLAFYDTVLTDNELVGLTS